MAHAQPPIKKGKTIFSFFKNREDDDQSKEDTPMPSNVDNSTPEFQSPPISPLVEPRQFVSTTIERDPGLRIQIHEYPVSQRDEVRRAYINLGPYQPKLSEYPKSSFRKQFRRFNQAWFKQFPWLEYSPSKDKAYCFPCFLFEGKNKSLSRSALTGDGFNNWKRVNDGANCAFLLHAGVSSSSHNNCEMCLENLKKSSQHIDKVMNAQSREEVLKNRMRLKATIQTVRLLALQGMPFRGHDESTSSLNRGNFIEVLKYKAEGHDELARIILENAPQNAQYIAPIIQKEILGILASRVRKIICDEIGGGNFCILVDESQDESTREQMALVLRYVNHDGFLSERFFYIVGVENTSASTLKKEICDILARYNL